MIINPIDIVMPEDHVRYEFGGAPWTVRASMEAANWNATVRGWLRSTGLPFVEHHGPWIKPGIESPWEVHQPHAVGNIFVLGWTVAGFENAPWHVVVFPSFRGRLHADDISSVDPDGFSMNGAKLHRVEVKPLSGKEWGWVGEWTWHKAERIGDWEAKVLFIILLTLPIRDATVEWDRLPPEPPETDVFFYETRLARWKQRARAALARRWAWMVGGGGGDLAIVEGGEHGQLALMEAR